MKHFSTTILIALSLTTGSFPLRAQESVLSRTVQWSYSRQTVLEFLGAWRIQLNSDPYLSETEKDLRSEFIDRLRFQVDRKYSGEGLREFLISASHFMALTDQMPSNQVWGGQAVFLENLSGALKDVFEPSENVLSFLRAFVEFSSLQRPRPLEMFSQSRSYTNGIEHQTAQPLSLEEAATEGAKEVPEAFDALEAPAHLPRLLEFDHNLTDEVRVELPPFSGSEIPQSPDKPTPDQTPSPSPHQTEGADLI